MLKLEKQTMTRHNRCTSYLEVTYDENLCA